MHFINCGSCGISTGCVLAAQFCHKKTHTVICLKCWDDGQRCWFKDDELIISKEQPEESKKAVLYWDEGLFVTKGKDLTTMPDGDIVTYPERNQPK